MNPHDPQVVEVVRRIDNRELDSDQAMEVLGVSHADLMEILDAHGMLLTPEDIAHDLRVLREFDQKHPPQPDPTGLFGWISRLFER